MGASIAGVKAHTTTFDAPPPQDFRAFLQAELARRCLDNPQYSLRAFAGRVGVDHSSLSQILRGRRVLTERTVRLICARLELPDERVEEFVAQLESHRENTGDPELRRLTADMVRVVSDWYHYAILELTHLDDFRPDSRWIARVLDITVDEVNAAVSRLASLRLLEMETPDRWVDRARHVAASFEDFTRVAVERWSEQMRARSATALAAATPQNREFTSTTIAAHTRRLPEVKRRIERFQRELVDLLERDTERNEVFQLDIHLYPLTNLNREA